MSKQWASARIVIAGFVALALWKSQTGWPVVTDARRKCLPSTGLLDAQELRLALRRFSSLEWVQSL